MAKPRPKIVGIDLNKNLILIHYVEDGDKIIDERLAAVRWKANPTLQRLVQAFAEVAANYILGGNTSLEKLDSLDMQQLFKDLLGEDLDTEK